MKMYQYNDIIYKDKAEAQSAANRCLREAMSTVSQAWYYVWNTEPIVDTTVCGFIWRGTLEADNITITADIIERNVS